MKNTAGHIPGRPEAVRRLFALAWQYRGRCFQVLFLQIILLTFGMMGLALSGMGIDIIRYEMEGHTAPPHWPLGLHPPKDLHGMDLLWLVAGGVLVFALARAVVNFLYDTAIANFVQGEIVVKMRSEVFEKLQRLDFRFFDSNASGSLINRVTGDVQSVRLFIDGVIIQSVIMVVSLVVYLAYMASIHIPLTLACLASTPLIWVLSASFSRVMRPKYLKNRRLFDEIVLWLSETVRGITVVKAFAIEPRANENFRSKNSAFYDQQNSIFRTLSLFIPGIDAVTQFNIVVLLAYGGWLVIQDQIALGAGLIVFASLLQQFGGQVSSIGTIMNSIQQSLTAAERVFEVLDAPVAIQSPTGVGITLENARGAVTFDNVSFRYGDGLLALENISLQVKPGQCIGIIGPTGSGKSTLLSLIPRFYDPSEGQITIDGNDARSLDVDSLRANVGSVFQESFLFSMSVADNIAFGRPRATREQIVKAGKIAAADKFIESLPEGYDTILRENGSSLSGGQRQRLAIARAILTDPRILLLDDPTAAVDAPTEREILNGMEQAMSGRTVFLATHRLAALRFANWILVMEGGRVVQQGTPSDLAGLSGYYRTLIELQVETENDE